MKNLKSKYALAALALLLLVPASLSARPRDNDRDKKCDGRGLRERKCEQVPEGGSATIYLLGAGLTCLGAMVIRSRSQAVTQS